MTFISYAQNFEDVMLWRALKQIEHGFYIDVGAAWPDEHSVTKSFYDKGWNGINIEPNPIHYSNLVLQRPRDTNLNIAISDYDGTTYINLVGDTGLSTLDNSLADEHTHHGWDSSKKQTNVETLASVCQKHIPSGQEIHFLKIDVEGLEKSVISGHDWNNFRPWIVVVEATQPMTQTESFYEWESLVVNNNYIFVYADGLNRFYLSKEHIDLQGQFRYPPNYFDDFEKIDLIYAQQSVVNLEIESKNQQIVVHNLNDMKNQLQSLNIQLKNENDALQRQYNLIVNSTIWKITTPYRYVFNNLKITVKLIFRKTLDFIANYVQQNPKLKNKAISLIHNNSLLKKIYLIYTNNKLEDEFHEITLSDKEKEIYNDLRERIINKGKHK